MNAFDELLVHKGEFNGVNRLWTSADQPADESASIIHVVPMLEDRFIRIDQTWAYEGQPQTGALLIGFGSKTEIATGHWIDSFHMGRKVMACQGIVSGTDTIDLLGSYAAPPGPDWGWRIQIIIPATDRLQITMHNIHPGGKQELAVDAIYSRG